MFGLKEGFLLKICQEALEQRKLSIHIESQVIGYI